MVTSIPYTMRALPRQSQLPLGSLPEISSVLPRRKVCQVDCRHVRYSIYAWALFSISSPPGLLGQGMARSNCELHLSCQSAIEVCPLPILKAGINVVAASPLLRDVVAAMFGFRRATPLTTEGNLVGQRPCLHRYRSYPCFPPALAKMRKEK